MIHDYITSADKVFWTDIIIITKNVSNNTDLGKLEGLAYVLRYQDIFMIKNERHEIDG